MFEQNEKVLIESTGEYVNVQFWWVKNDANAQGVVLVKNAGGDLIWVLLRLVRRLSLEESPEAQN